MVRLSNLADYAVMLLVRLAAEPSALLSAAALSETTGLSPATVGKILGVLTRSGLLHSQRGTTGGFRLARAANEITVTEIVEAVDGPIALTNCLEDSGDDCSVQSFCSMRSHWSIINSAIRGALSDVTLAELAASNTPEAFAAFFERQPEARH